MKALLRGVDAGLRQRQGYARFHLLRGIVMFPAEGHAYPSSYCSQSLTDKRVYHRQSEGLMDIPRFVRSELNPDLVADHTDGDAYQLFMYDILRGDFPGLRSYATAGKDGAIDLARSAPGGGRQIFECKFVGSDDQKEVKRRWAEVADKLDRNLAKPEGPPTGQSQYGTWYVPEPITVYYFCTSSLYSNETAYQELKSEIDQFFVELAQRPHLEHLRGIRVHAESWAQTRAIIYLPYQDVLGWK